MGVGVRSVGSVVSRNLCGLRHGVREPVWPNFASQHPEWSGCSLFDASLLRRLRKQVSDGRYSPMWCSAVFRKSSRAIRWTRRIQHGLGFE